MSQHKIPHIFVVDNYDSFTYNLVHYFESLDVEVTIKRNDEFELEELESYDKIVLSPGPGLPKDAGLLLEVIAKYHRFKPILGVCLGHQALAQYFGARLINLPEVFHGVSSKIELDNSHYLFHGLSEIEEVGRYHSWAISDWPNTLREIAYTTENFTNMAFYHKEYNCVGVQFHPESVLTPNGLKMIENWVIKS
ncbi:MAG: aminodeoxychorismate/anthranilate synthase component II [Flavobacteriales bacterium]